MADRPSVVTTTAMVVREINFRNARRVNKNSKYAAMTTNERLFEAGLLNEFDQACRERNRAQIIELLNRVDLEHQCASIADSILANPKLYGC
jgi:hypothetical protein